MAVKLTDLGILIYVVMALYLAAAGAYAKRRWLGILVLGICGLGVAGLAAVFGIIAIWLPTFFSLFSVFFCTTIIFCAALVIQLVATTITKRNRLAGTVLFASGFGFAAVAFVLRWVEVNHVPLQNMFEVFLCLGALMWPITLFSRRFLGVGGEAADAVLGFIVLFPAGFVFNAAPQHLPPALDSSLFIPHVAAYMLSYVILAKAALPTAFLGLFRDRPEGDPAALAYEAAANRIARLGFPLLTLGLVLGMWWGKRAWGDYWNWDPKELWSFISWLVYLAYFHFRYMFGLRFKRANCAFLVVGLAAIVLTLLWVNLARIFSGGMHSYAS